MIRYVLIILFFFVTFVEGMDLVSFSIKEQQNALEISPLLSKQRDNITSKFLSLKFDTVQKVVRKFPEHQLYKTQQKMPEVPGLLFAISALPDEISERIIAAVYNKPHLFYAYGVDKGTKTVGRLRDGDEDIKKFYDLSLGKSLALPLFDCHELAVERFFILPAHEACKLYYELKKIVDADTSIAPLYAVSDQKQFDNIMEVIDPQVSFYPVITNEEFVKKLPHDIREFLKKKEVTFFISKRSGTTKQRYCLSCGFCLVMSVFIGLVPFSILLGGCGCTKVALYNAFCSPVTLVSMFGGGPLAGSIVFAGMGLEDYCNSTKVNL